ncbi:MAG: DUF5106 domain-containing protein [Muribaculaceae bacterium]|nr:DUF5106 domain-containing protein [Muribaculaceae bacterium]
MLKRLIFCLLMLTALAAGAQTDASQTDRYFQYPIVPDSIRTFSGRCDYLAEHFFDFCDLGKAFSNRARMGEEFKTYLTIIANATPKTAIKNAADLMKKLEKQPKDQVYLANIAEGMLYGDTARAWIDDLYLPFAEAVASNRRVDKAEKARFAQQATILKNNMVGTQAPEIEFTLPDGSTSRLTPDSTQVTVLFFNDPDCSGCSMARVRLSADISTNELIKEGKLRVVAISLVEPDEKWRQYAAEMPAEWTVGAAPDADLTFDLRNGTPDFYVLGLGNKIRFKHLDTDQLLDVTRQLKKR